MSAAFFDLDGTLWAVSGEKAFARHLHGLGVIDRRQLAGVAWNYLRYELGLIHDYDALKTRALRGVFAGLEAERIEALYQDFFAARLRPLFFPAMAETIARHRHAGEQVVIVSASLGFMVAKAAGHLGADAFYGTQLEVAAGHYTGEVTGRIYYGETKVLAVEDHARRHGLDPAACHAYGDRFEDRHMLGRVGHAVAVNPDRRLAALARRGGWRICQLPSPQER